MLVDSSNDITYLSSKILDVKFIQDIYMIIWLELNKVENFIAKGKTGELFFKN